MRGLLKSKRYDLCTKLIEIIIEKSSVPDDIRAELNKLLGICHAMLGDCKTAIDILSGNNDSVSSLIALAHCKVEAKKKISMARSIDSGKVDLLISRYYPELAHD